MQPDKAIDEVAIKNDPRTIRQMSDEEAIVRVNSDFADSESKKQEDNERNERYLNIYQALDPPEEAVDDTSGLVEDNEAAYANNYMPVGAAVVDTVTAKYFNTFFSTNEYMEIGADNFQDFLFSQEITAHLMKRHREMKFRSLMYRAIQQASCFDYCIIGTRWLLEAGFVGETVTTRSMKQFGKISLPYQEVKTVPRWRPDKIDRSDIFVLNFFRCFHDYTSQNGFEDSRYFIDLREARIDDLQENAKNEDQPFGRYKNIDKIIESVTISDEGDLEQLESEAEKLSYISARRVTIKRYWTRDHIVETAQGHVIRRMDIYGWPLVKMEMYPVPNSFSGMGYLQRMERNQYDINATMNARRNFQNLVADPWVILDQDIVSQGDGEPRVYSGKVFVSSGGDAKSKAYVYTPQVNANQDAMIDLQAQMDINERVTGASDNDQGQISAGRTTATEVRQASAGTGGRFFSTSRRIEEEVFEPLYLQQFLLEQAFLSKAEQFRHMGKHGATFVGISPAHYRWESTPNFSARGTLSLQEDAVKDQQFFAAIDRSIMLQQLGVKKFDWDNITIEMWRRLVPQGYENFVEDDTVPKVNIPPDVENMMIMNGQETEVSPLNDPQEHLASHEGVKKGLDYLVWPEMMKARLEEHIAAHQQSGQQQQQIPQLGQGGQDQADQLRGLRGASPGVVQ